MEGAARSYFKGYGYLERVGRTVTIFTVPQSPSLTCFSILEKPGAVSGGFLQGLVSSDSSLRSSYTAFPSLLSSEVRAPFWFITLDFPHDSMLLIKQLKPMNRELFFFKTTQRSRSDLLMGKPSLHSHHSPLITHGNHLIISRCDQHKQYF